MKRMLIAAASSSMLALAAPGLASAAHTSKCHHHTHHACAKTRHASRARVLTFGRPSSATGTPSGTTPTVPSSPSEPAETAGTVASFTGGVLTITLKDGSTVSGKVTETTELRCQSGAPPTEAGDDDQNGDEASGGNGDDGAPQGGPLAGSHGDHMSGAGDGEDGGAGQPSTCTTAALVPGAVVAEAELSVGGSGAVWDHVDLIS